MTEAQKIANHKWYHSDAGRAYYASKAEKRLADRRARRQERRKWLDEYRATLRCSRCPENHPSCLEFHHTEDNKEFQIGASTTRDIPIERIQAEIAKCIVLCSNCHKKHHYAERQLASDEEVLDG